MNCSNKFKLDKFLALDLKEDIGKGDITSRLTLPRNLKIDAMIVAGETGILCGIDIVKSVFKKIDSSLKFSSGLKDGSRIYKGKSVAKIRGRAGSILSGERVALNFLGFLSGIASRTRVFVEKVKPFKVKILDTRKTLPGLRLLEKYAVRVGGGFNHRLGLDEMILVKENHIDASGWQRIRIGLKSVDKSKIKLEIEARDLKEFRDALLLKPDIIMLDNMQPEEIRKAVRMRNRFAILRGALKPRLEVSGNISLDNVVAYAATGIDFISLGTLTKDIESFDFSLAVK